MRLLRLAHDPERRLVPRGEVPLKLHQLSRVTGGVQHHLRVQLLAVKRPILTTLHPHHRPVRLVRHVLHRARAETHPLVDASSQKFILERDAVHPRVGAVQLIPGPVVVDDDARLRPHLIEAVGEVELFELVDPHAVIVAPGFQRARVDERDA